MFFTLFTLGSFVAFISLVWKETLNTFPAFKNAIKKRMSVLARKPLFCGFCFTSWIAFFTALAAAPLLKENFFIAWPSIAVTALLIRNAIIAIEELVHWEVHILNGQTEDLH